VARLVGPALAGIGISAFGTGWVFLVNGASTLAVLLALTMMRTEELYPSPAAKRSAGQYGAVVHYVRARPDLVLPFVLSFVVGTLSASYPVTLAMIAKQLFHRDAGAYGLLTAMLAVGAVAGALVATQRRRRPSRAFVLLAALAFGVTECGAGLMPTFTTTAIALIPAGLAMLVFSQGANAMVQLGVEPSMRGRVLGLYMLCMLGGTPVGSIAVGWLGQHAGPRWGLVGGGLCCIAITVTIGAVLLRRQPAPIRRIQTRLVPVRT
jgi:predicted MFS family arabinose efflux permease